MVTGYLQIKAVNGMDSSPISNVELRVSGSNMGEHSLMTDSFGMTKSIPVYMPEGAFSSNLASSHMPISLYDIRVECNGYHSTTMRDVKINPGMETVLPVDLVRFNGTMMMPEQGALKEERAADKEPMKMPHSYEGNMPPFSNNWHSVPQMREKDEKPWQHNCMQCDNNTVQKPPFKMKTDKPDSLGTSHNKHVCPCSKPFYIVQAGDTLYLIAETYGTTVDEIKMLNCLTSDDLWIGQTLKIPNSTCERRDIDCDKNRCKKPALRYIEHIVESGDTLWSLANKHNTSVQAIMEMSGITSDYLKVGQRLKIPMDGGGTHPDNPGTKYTVKSGDSLWTIAQHFGTSVDEIMKANRLTSTMLYIGQTLYV